MQLAKEIIILCHHHRVYWPPLIILILQRTSFAAVQSTIIILLIHFSTLKNIFNLIEFISTRSAIINWTRFKYDLSELYESSVHKRSVCVKQLLQPLWRKLLWKAPFCMKIMVYGQDQSRRDVERHICYCAWKNLFSPLDFWLGSAVIFSICNVFYLYTHFL